MNWCRIIPTRMGCRGFSLFELLVVLFIVGIMAAMVGPRLTGSLPTLKVKTAAKQTAALLRHARSRAVTENRIFLANFDLIANHLEVVPKEVEPAEETEEPAAPPQPLEFQLPEAVFFKIDATAEQLSISFFPGGGSSGGIIMLANKKRAVWQITVDGITGNVSLSDER